MSRANFVQVQLAQAATDIQTTLSVKAPTGGFKLPPADGGRLVLTDSLGQPSAFEVITYTGRTGSGPYTLTGVVRGVEGTVGLAWGVDTFVLQALTVGDLQELMDSKLGVGATAVAAVKLATARTINGVAFDGSADITVVDATKEPAIPAGTTAQYVAGNKTLRTFAADVCAAALTGLNTATNSAIAAADTLLVAMGKLQAQITGLATSKLDATANAVSATKLATARTINGVAFDGSANITVADSTKLPLTGGAMTGTITYQNVGVGEWARGFEGRIASAGALAAGLGILGSSDTISSVYMGLGASPWSNGNGVRVTSSGVTIEGATNFTGVISGNGAGLTTLDAANLASGIVPDARLSGTYSGVNITGNAGTAAKLQTARTIGGVSFDGTADINLPGVNAAGNQNTSGNAATATKLATGRTIGMTGDVTWTSPAFDGSGNVTAAATLANTGVTAGTYGKVTVNAKGLVTAGAALAAADIPALDTGKLTTGTLPIALGGTGGATADAARTALGIGTAATRNITISTAEPSGGANGDLWFKV